MNKNLLLTLTGTVITILSISNCTNNDNASYSKQTSRLIKAVQSGKITEIEKKLREGANPYKDYKLDDPALLIAVQNRQDSIAELILNLKKPGEDDKDCLNKTLWTAVLNNMPSMVNILLKNGAEPKYLYRKYTNDGYITQYAFMYALQKGYPGVVKSFLDNGLDPLSFSSGITVSDLLNACGNDSTRWIVASTIFKRPFKEDEFSVVFGDESDFKKYMTSQSSESRKELSEFITKTGYVDGIRKLEKLGYLPDSKDDLIFIAVQLNYIPMVEYLCEKVNLDRKIRLDGKQLSLTIAEVMYAVSGKQQFYKLEQYFSEKALKWNPLMKAAAYGETKTAEQILTSNSNIINSVDREGNTALILAIEYNNFDVFKLLLQKGASLDIPKKKPPFIKACARGRIDMVKAIIDKNPDPPLGITYKSLNDFIPELTMVKLGAMVITTSPDKMQRYEGLNNAPGSEEQYDSIVEILRNRVNK